MRNLKRALSLALASVMVLGLMVAGSSAKGYDDVTSEENVEAIEVLQAVGIMTGDDNGNFNPTQNVTRNEMAVIMSNLMDYRVATYKGTSPFTDVPEWAEPYVAACYTNGIIAGYSATTFGGSDPVVTSQATLMILKALGYFQVTGDFGDDWQLATINQANKVDLLVGVDSAVRVPMTRNDVAQLVLNGLTAGTVEADTSNNINVTVGDAMVSVGGTKYDYVTSTQDYARTIRQKQSTTNDTDASAYIVELGEKLYQGDLTRRNYEDNGHDDVFGRPATRWEYQAKEVGTYVDAADYEWYAKVTSKTLYDTVGRTATTYDWTVVYEGDDTAVTGGQVSDNKSDNDLCFVRKALGDSANRTGNGVVTQVFVDGTKREVRVAIMPYYAAEVLKVNSSDDPATITLSKITGSARTTDTYETDDFAAGDIVVYSYAANKIQDVYAAEAVEGEVTRVRSNTNDTEGDNFVVDGTTYSYNKTTTASNKLTTDNVGGTVMAYKDAYDYIVWIDESEVAYNYAYVLSMGTDKDMYGGSTGATGTTVYARLILSDGTMVKAQTSAKTTEIGTLEGEIWKPTTSGLLGHIVSYSVDSKGVYTLSNRSDSRYIAAADDLEVSTGVSGFRAEDQDTTTFGSDHTGRYAANANTVFVVGESAGKLDDYQYSVYTGVKNVPDINGLEDDTRAVVATGANSRIAKMVYIEDADVSGKDVIFIRADREAKLVRDSQIGNYYEINAYLDGEAVTLNVKEDSNAADLLRNAVQGTHGMPLNGAKTIVAAKSITRNEDDLVTNVSLYKAYGAEGDGDGWFYGVGTKGRGKDEVGLLYDSDRRPVAGTPTGAVLNTDANFGWNEDTISVGYDEYNEGKFIDFGVGSVTDDTNDRYFGILDGDALIGLFIWDIDDVSGSGSGSGGRPSSGSETGPMSTIATVNEMLKDGSVIVTGDWEPEAGTINIPANTTLYIDGNFDASRVTINGTSATTSKVIVDGKLTIAPSSAKTVNSNIQADSALLDCGSGTLTVRGTLLVDNDLHVKGTSNAINLDGTVTVTGKIIGDEPSSNTTVNANGTVSAAGVEGKVTINVFSTESLHISGTVASSVTIVVGDGSSASNNGYATIGTLEGTLQNKNVNEVAAKTPTVEVVAAGAVVKVEQTGANVTITGTLATDQVVIVAGGKVTLQAGTTIEDDAEDLLVDTETGAPVTGTGNSNLVIAPATDVDTTEGGTIEVETPEDAVTADAATAEVFFVYSAATWELAKEKGVPASFMGGDGSFNANAASEPWLVVKITPAGTASGAVTDLAFTGPNGTITHQLDNTTGTISVTEGTAKILAVDLRIPDGKWNGVQAKDYLKQEKAVKGDYSVSFTFNEKTITSEPAAYDGPEAALAAGDVGYIGASEKNIHPYPADEAAVKTLYSGAPFVDYVAATVSTGLSQSYNNGTIALSGAVKDLSAVEANNANLISAMKFFSNETAGASVEAFTTRYAIENGTKWGFVAIAIESGINWILIVNSGDGWMIVADDADGQPQRHSSLTWNLKIGSETKEYTVDVSGLK